MNELKIIFRDFMYVNGKLYMETESEIDETISDEMDAALTELGMYREWVEVDGNIKFQQYNGEYEFTKEELIKIVKCFGKEEDVSRI